MLTLSDLRNRTRHFLKYVRCSPSFWVPLISFKGANKDVAINTPPSKATGDGMVRPCGQTLIRYGPELERLPVGDCNQA